MDAFFAGLATTSSGHVKPPIQRHELDCKMTIVVRADKKSGITGGGTSAKLVSHAVIKAYEQCKGFDPVSLLQWETNAWTKICLRVSSDKQIRDIHQKAIEVGVNCYLLEKSVSLKRPKNQKMTDATSAEEEKESQVETQPQPAVASSTQGEGTGGKKKK